ncbi:MAG: alpha-mannosidase, partial [Vallitaleaceae bacterium]|nr:alpha-mannosidase [Vallitaleaceae bacterium]
GSFSFYRELKEWTKYQTGHFWGAKSQYCLFKTEVVIPERFHGKKVVFGISTGHKEGWDVSNPQFLIYINDVLRQGLDVNHKHTLLSEQAVSGSTFNVVLLGHSGIEEEKVILTSALKVIDPLLEDFYYNLSNLFWTLSLMEMQDYQRPDLLRKLIECVDLLDLRRDYSEEFYHSVKAANEYLVKNYYTEVNTSGPLVTTIGHTHIDVAWLWTIEQTKEKVVRSFSTVLELMEQFPEYQFMSSQPQLYEFVKEYDPPLYNKIKQKVKEGRWEVDGGMWLEADCNLPSGESLSRQFLYGTQFIKKEFDVDCTTLWLPDVFGYSAALPQLIKKSGLSYMMTSKLDWNSHNKMPHDTFIWRGIDGSEILTHLITTTNAASYHEDIYQKREENAQTTYNGRLNPNQVKGTWTRYQDQLLSDETLQLFGFGDGGGGPTEEMLENYKRLKYGLPGVPRTAMDFQKHYFQRLQSKVDTSPYIRKWQGELYLEFHQGTYTSMAKNKRANRKAEFLYQKVEFLNTLAHLLNHDYSYPSEEIRSNWKRILLYQFHDIIPGTSISEVYQVTDQGYHEIFQNGEKLINKAMTAFGQELKLPKDSCVVVNPLSHSRTDLVSFEVDGDEVVTKVTDVSGKSYPVSYDPSENEYTFLAQEVPPMGLKCYQLHFEQEEKSDFMTDVSGKISDFLPAAEGVKEVQNCYYHVRFNEAMEIVSLYDKENHREMIKKDGRGNILQLFEDRPRRFDNWNIDASYKDKVYELDQVESVELIEDNPFYTGVRITRKYGLSTLVQKILIYHHHKRIDFCTEADWHE